MKKIIAIFALFLSIPISATALVNGGFELPVIGGSAYRYFPQGADIGWVFDYGDGSGISGGQSAFTNGNPLSAGQVAFISGYGVMRTKVSLSPGTHTVSFRAAQRLNFQLGSQTLGVYVDGIKRGTFTPIAGSYLHYETEEFVVPSAGLHDLVFRGEGSGADFTAFIDDVKVMSVAELPIKTDVSFPGNPRSCDPSLAEFNVNFGAAHDPYRAGIWVRHMDSVGQKIISSPSWYDASQNTLLGAMGELCARGPHSVPTAPHDLDAQSTFQMTGKSAGFLILSRDAKDSMNGHAFYGLQDYPALIFPWRNDGDALAFEAKMRMTMTNILHVSSAHTPVGQFYVALNAYDTTAPENDPKVIQFSIAAYDSRDARSNIMCDWVVGAEGKHAIIQTSFSLTQENCSGEKFMESPVGSAIFRAGDSGPGNGAWYDTPTYKAKLTKEALVRAIKAANVRVGGFDPDPAKYRLGAVGVIQEMIWFHKDDGIDMAVSFSDLKAKLHSAQ